jgi:uncharacterized protein (TIGR00156 family)
MRKCKHIVFAFVVFAFIAFMFSTIVYGQGGFTGPDGRANSREPQTVTVNQARILPDNSIVILTGNIVRAFGDEWYRFRDETGEILIEIDRRLWYDLSVSENDRVEITGKLESGLGRAVIDVKSIRKI